MNVSKKSEVITRLYQYCQKKGDFNFHNDLVKKISADVGFSNPFDATKIDNKNKLPPMLQKNDTAIIHLGGGNHRFIKGIDSVYHDFEPIQQTVPWHYRKSLLNHFNSSESNILSVANNQRILHHFLFGYDADNNTAITKRPKFYFPHRMKISFPHFFDEKKFFSKTIQIGLTVELHGNIEILEYKNNDCHFSVYQLYYPLLYYYQRKQQTGIKDISGTYVNRQKNASGNSLIRFWRYTFSDMSDIASIKFLKASAYELIENQTKNLS